MSTMPVEGSEDKYAGSELYQIYQEGREAMMEGLGLEENPYLDQPHLKAKSEAWSDGWKDEDLWRLDSTGR